MITQGPRTLTIGAVVPLSDPGATSNNPATAVQLQNASPFIISVNSGGTVLTLQPFTSQTVATSGGGQQMSATPIAAGGSAQLTAVNSLIVVWLLAGEQAPMPDGPLTAAALAFSLGTAGLSGASVITGKTTALAPGATGFPTGIGAAPIKLWVVGFIPGVFGTGPWPTIGGVAVTFGSGAGATESMGWTQGASNRLAGLITSGVGIEFTNYTDQSIIGYLDYSAA